LNGPLVGIATYAELVAYQLATRDRPAFILSVERNKEVPWAKRRSVSDRGTGD